MNDMIPAKQPVISVIIPTYNRARLLEQSLESLTRQNIAYDQYEVIVVDDGSTDETAAICNKFYSRLQLKYFFQRNSGNAAAKNLGIFASSGQIVFFFDDDDIADRNLLVEHVKSHQEYPQENIAVLGYTGWSSALDVTPVMRYITDVGGLLFSYTRIEEGKLLDFTYFWGGRSSCKRSLLIRRGIFNQNFRWTQDIELGYRLSKVGLRVLFNRNAVSHMVRPVTYEQFCVRCEKKGRAKFMLSRLHPDPVILTYSNIGDAEDNWERARMTLDADVQKIHMLESIMGNEIDNKEKERLVKELWELYRSTFRAFELKGIVDAINEYREKEEADHCLKVTDDDMDYFRKKWAHMESLRDAPVEGQRDKVLVISRNPPMFDRASGEFRLYQMVKILNKHFDVVFLACDARGAERYVEYLRESGVTVYCNDVERFPYLNSLEGILPLDLEIILKHNDFKAAFLMFYHISEKYIDLIRRHSPKTAVITDSVDLHFMREFREADIMQDEEKHFKAEINKKRELSTYDRSDITITVTEDDRSALLKECGALDVRVIPNIHEISDNEISGNGRQGLIFVGGFSHLPNIDAVLYFCKEVLPLIQREITDVKLTIVGNAPPLEVLDLQDENIIVTGYVAETKPYIDSALISVAPLRYGAGMKGKIGEALANGLPVVTTSIGAEGMGVENGEHLLIADNPEDFARAVIGLYNNKIQWENLSGKGRKLIRNNYSDYAVEKNILDIMKSLPVPGVKRTRRFSIELPAGGFETAMSVRDKVTAVVPVINNHERFRRCIENILKNTDNLHEIIAVDDGSADDIADWLERKCIRYIRNKNKSAFEYVCMQGIALCSSEYVAIIDGDTVVTPHWDTRLISHLKNRSDLAAVAPMLPCRKNYQTFYQLENLAWQVYQNNKGQLKETSDISKSACILLNLKTLREGGYGKGNLRCPSFSTVLSGMKISGFKTAFAKDAVVHNEKEYSTPAASFNKRRSPVKRLSVIIQRYTNKENLKAVIEHLMQQSIPRDKFDIVISGSGEEYGINKWIKAAYPGIDIKIIQSGRDSINNAVNEAVGEYILFIKEDMLADGKLLEQHLRVHEEMSLEDIVVLGNTSCPPGIRDNDVMECLTAKRDGKGSIDLSFDPSYGTSMSAKRETFLNIGIDGEAVFGWQVLEFCRKARLNGRKIITNKNAVVYPRDTLRLQDIITELIGAGKEFVLLALKHPSRIWNLQDARRICQKDFYGKEGLIRTFFELCHELEKLPGHERNLFVFGDRKLSDIFYATILNYYYAKGIYSALTDFEGEHWLERFLQTEHEDGQAVVKMINAENIMYEQLIKGIVEDKHGNLTRAIEHAEDAGRSLPAAPHSYFCLGEYYLQTGRFDMAETSFETCIMNQSKYSQCSREIIPVADYVSNNFYLAFSCMNQGKHDKTIKIIEGLIENKYIFKRNQELICHLYLAKCYDSKGMASEAIEYYQKVLDKEAGNAEAAYNLSVIYLKLNEENTAMSILKKCAKENTGHVSLIPAKDGSISASVQRNGRELTLHSRYRPQKEAEDNLIDSGGLNNMIIVQLGVGLGYPVLAVWNTISSETPVLAIERDNTLFNLALIYNLWDEFVSHERLTALAGRIDYSDVIKTLATLSGKYPGRKITVIKHPSSFSLYPKYYNGLYKKVVEFADDAERTYIGSQNCK